MVCRSATQPSPRGQKETPQAPPVSHAPPKPRRVVRWIMTRPDHPADDDATELDKILARS
jgi:hypothetical protein